MKCDPAYQTLHEHHTMCLGNTGVPLPLEEEEKSSIVTLHNSFRGAVTDPGNVLKLIWDEELSKIAAKWAQQCELAHDQFQERTALGLPGVLTGQNVARRSGPVNFTAAVVAWAEERQHFTYGEDAAPDQVVGHYTQIIFGKTSRIGCGQALCDGLKYYVCNYAPIQTNMTNPYCRGEACPTCASLDDSTGLCDCGGRVCCRGGSLDASTCTCTCPPHTQGDTCEQLDCPYADPVYCPGMDKAPVCTYKPVLCPIKCGLCSQKSCNLTCANGGTLTRDTCTCRCEAGYQGSECEEPTCTIACENGTLNMAPCRCMCHEGWTGPACDCDKVCNNGGTLNPDSCTCTCEGGYGGPMCLWPPCDLTCENGKLNRETCTCTCQPAWKGSRCDCKKNCYNDGVLEPETCTCACVNGYRGDKCLRQPCKTECLNGTVNQDNCQCECNAGWSGPKCDCSLSCENGGTLFTRYCRCQCAHGYRGADCSLEPCNTPCVNGRVLQTDCSCKCQVGWKGPDCNCNKRCYRGELDAATCTCNCEGGWRGPTCSAKPCKRVCAHGSNDPVTCQCICDEGWSGPTCACGKQCKNGGSLNANRCTCSCTGGYRGPECSLPPCPPTCVNGHQDKDTCTCQCHFGWSGEHCDCSKICNNNGTLEDDCTCSNCAGGFTGDMCELCDTTQTCLTNQILSPATCLCEDRKPCNSVCAGDLQIYGRTCVCTPQWVDCGQVDAGDCTAIAQGGFCSPKSNQASCPQACRMCNSNFVYDDKPVTSIESTANSNAVFSGACGEPPFAEHGTVQVDGDTFMSVAVYTCDSPFTGLGMPLSQCLESGKWTDLAFICVSKTKRSTRMCGPPPSRARMTVDFSSMLPGAEATYSCKEGYNPQGFGRTICLPGGVWSKPPLVCKPKESSWTPMKNVNSRKRDVSAVESRVCIPTVSVQESTGTTTTKHYSKTAVKYGPEDLGFTRLRLAKINWKTFESKPTLELHSFTTSGKKTVVQMNNKVTTELSSFQSESLWMYQNDSCLSPADEGFLRFIDTISDSLILQRSSNLKLAGVGPELAQPCIDTCWQHVLHKQELIDEVVQGHEVIVKDNGVQFSPEDVFIYKKNFVVTLQNISTESNSQTPTQNWSTLSFEGRTQTCHHEMFSSKPSWFLDTRPWKKVLTIDRNGTVIFGSRLAVIASVASSKKLRVGVVHANSMRRYMSINTVVWHQQGEVAVEILHHPRLFVDTSGLSLSSDCRAWSAILTTGGQYTVYEHGHGTETGRHRSITDVASTDWFVH